MAGQHNSLEESDRLLGVSLQSYRLLFEHTGESVFSVDRDGRVTSVNPAGVRAAGRPEQEIIGASYETMVDPADLPDARQAFAAALAGEHVELRVQLIHGTDDRRTVTARIMPLVVDDEVVGVLGLAQDVTDWEMRQEALRQSDERFGLVTRATRETIWDADLVTGITTWTGAIGPMFGIEGTTFAFDESWWLDHIHPDDMERVVPTLDALLASDGDTWEAEYRLARLDGHYAAVLERGHIVREASGRPVRMVGSMMDITGRRRREEQLRHAQHEAEEASQAKSLFLANMSHEIRTPMNGVIGMVELLLGTDLDPEQKVYAETIHQSGERLLDIINDILDLSKIEAGKMSLEPVDFDLQALVEETASVVALSADRKGLAFTTVVPPSIEGRFRGDPGRIGQVLTNLLSNAVKFTDVGEVTLTVDRAAAAPGGPECVRFAVRDTGIGISESQQGRLFQSFSQADASTTRRYGGTGLGLALCKQLVEMMGGSISVTSSEGVGSEFTVDLPLQPVRAAAGEPRAESPTVAIPATAAAGARRRVLLVEDNDVNQRVANLLLDRLGYDVEVAENGAQALSALEGEEFAAVLMDVHMPVMDGIEATRRLRQRESGGVRRTPIIAMTASALKGDRERMLQVGMDDYIAKPARLDELDGVLRRWTAAAPAESLGEPEGQASRLTEAADGAREPGGAADPLDDDVVGTLVALGRKARPGFLGGLYQSFAAESAASLDELDRASAAADTAAIVAAAHGLKGSSASMGARALSECCAQIVALGRAGDTAAASALGPDARVEHARGLDALRAALGVEEPGTAAADQPAEPRPERARG